MKGILIKTGAALAVATMVWLAGVAVLHLWRWLYVVGVDLLVGIGIDRPGAELLSMALPLVAGGVGAGYYATREWEEPN